MRAEARVLLLATALLGGCEDRAVTASRLEESRSAWESAGVMSYTIEVSMTDGGNLSRRVTVTVSDGAIVAGTLREGDVAIELNQTQSRPYTVEGLFRILDAEVETNRRSWVRAWFDPEHGRPDRIELGPFRDDPEGAGVRLLEVERFEPDLQ